jgi:hypothetical protein
MNGAEFANTKACTRLLAFIGSPHRWTDTQDLEDKVAKFIMSKAPGTFKGREAKRLASITSSIAGAFVHTGMLIRATIVNVYSTIPSSTEVGAHIVVGLTASYKYLLVHRCLTYLQLLSVPQWNLCVE